MSSSARLWVGRAAALLLMAGLAGCASPGLPKPPTLNLPTPVNDLEAARELDRVTLRFTAPAKTTDKLAVKGPMAAALCRQESGGACREVLRQNVQSGKEITLTDTLPQALTVGAPVLLTYKVSLFNDKGRTAGAGSAAYMAGGAAPAAVAELTVAPAPDGAMLRWRAERGTDVVELERRHKAKPGAAASKPADAGNPFATPKEPEEQRLSAGEHDAGGTMDEGAKFGEGYTYVAWRVRRLTLTGHAVEVRSAASAMVTVEMRDVFPPAVPKGLTAVPATAGAGLAGIDLSGIDLSWEPNSEADLAGYFVYRATVGSGAAAVKLNAAPVEGPAYHDASAAAGVRYRYSVSAIDQSGNESGRSAEVEEGIQ